MKKPTEPVDLAELIREGVQPLFPVVYEIDYSSPAGDEHGRPTFSSQLYRSRHSEVVVQVVEVETDDGQRVVTMGEYGTVDGVTTLEGTAALAGAPFLEDTPDGLAIKRQIWPEPAADLAEHRRRRGSS